MTTATQPMTFQAWLAHYEQCIRPLRGPADEGTATYAAYDEAYNEHLELLHQMIGDKAPLLDNAAELADAAAAYTGALPDFSDFEIEPSERELWDTAYMRLQRVLDVVWSREPRLDYAVEQYELWLRTFLQEYLRRVGVTWEDAAGDEETAQQYHADGFTPTLAVTAEVRRYGLADAGVT